MDTDSFGNLISNKLWLDFGIKLPSNAQMPISSLHYSLHYDCHSKLSESIFFFFANIQMRIDCIKVQIVIS